MLKGLITFGSNRKHFNFYVIASLIELVIPHRHTHPIATCPMPPFTPNSNHTMHFFDDLGRGLFFNSFCSFKNDYKYPKYFNLG